MFMSLSQFGESSRHLEIARVTAAVAITTASDMTGLRTESDKPA